MSTSESSKSYPGKRLYFAYGSNLSLTQMNQRCPASKFVGIARLKGWSWIINERGYANVVKDNEDSVVFGLVYALTARDELKLDGYEGVPWAYEKDTVPVDIVFIEQLDIGSPKLGVEGLSDWESHFAPEGLQTLSSVLVYVDRLRITPDHPKKEYVQRMRRAVTEAKMAGIPKEWLLKVVGAHLDLGETFK